MNARFVLIALVFASSPLAVPAVEPGKVAPKETELEERMDVIGGVFRKLRRQIGDPAKAEDSLKLIVQLREAAVASAKPIPAKAAEIPEAERAAFIASYEAKMRDFVGEVDKLHDAAREGKLDEAAKVPGQLNALQKSGHKEFKKPDRKG